MVLPVIALARAWGRLAATAVAAFAVFYVLTPIALTAMAWNGALALTLWSAVFAIRGLQVAEPAARRRCLLAAGLLAGLALTFRPDLIVAVALVFAWLLWRHPPTRRPVLIGAAIGLIPMVVQVAMAGPAKAFQGMVLDPVRDAGVMTFLNHYWPFSYAHMRRYLDFKTRVFRKYAVAHNLDFVDVSGVFPRDSRLFNDGIHMTRAGIHLQAWVVFNGLVPVLDRRLASHQWPRPARHSLSKHPAFPGRGRLVPMTEVSQACGADGKPSPHE
jgi:hypothetical protein